MGRYVVGIFEHGLAPLDVAAIGDRLTTRLPGAFAAAYSALAARWQADTTVPAWHGGADDLGTRENGDPRDDAGIRYHAGLVTVELGARLVRVRPGPRWLGFALLGDLRELCRVLVWSVGVALERRSPVVFGPDQDLDELSGSFDDVVLEVERRLGARAEPLAGLQWLHLFGKPSGDWSLDALTDVTDVAPLATFAAVTKAFRAHGGVELKPHEGRREMVSRSAEELAADAAAGRELVAHVRLPESDRDAAGWSGLLTARIAAPTGAAVEVGAFRDIYAPQAPVIGFGIPDDGGDDDERVIAAAIEHARTMPGCYVELQLRALETRSARLALSAEQVRMLAAAGASLDITVEITAS